jgi:hypothetical protein
VVVVEEGRRGGRCCGWVVVIGWSGCLVARDMFVRNGCLMMLWRSECADVRRCNTTC